jgi:succinate dehydrogenase/fumarate reductase flavoprotein subunit
MAYREGLDKSAFDLPASVFERPSGETEKAFEKMLQRETGDGTVAQLLGELRAAMADGCGLERDADGLEKLLETLVGLEERARQVSVRGPKTNLNPEAVLAFELPDALALARAVASAALSREESRGTHRRLDRDAAESARPRATLVKSAAPDAEVIDGFEYRLGRELISIRAEANHGE